MAARVNNIVLDLSNPRLLVDQAVGLPVRDDAGKIIGRVTAAATDGKKLVATVKIGRKNRHIRLY